MQFKYPGVLWALFLLAVPIIIHLFQLRKYKQTPFTNVKWLQKVVINSRKSSQLKKWLILVTRMLLFAALIIAFAQPFTAKETAFQEKELLIYLDNSFSMQAKENNISLLDNAKQELIKNIAPNTTFTLFTNNEVFRKVTLKDIQNNLLQIEVTPTPLAPRDIFLKANSLFSNKEGVQKHFLLVSDFNQKDADWNLDHPLVKDSYFIPQRTDRLTNIAIDSLYISKNLSTTLELTAVLSAIGNTETIGVSLNNKDTLLAKTAANFTEKQQDKVVFTIPNKEIAAGKVQLEDISGLQYDNTLFFTIQKKEKIKVLVVSDTEGNYLNRIYTEDEFSLTKVNLNQLNYGSISSQNLIVLDELPQIPTALKDALVSFKNEGGSIAVIPEKEADISTYNPLLQGIQLPSLGNTIAASKEMTTIHFSNPLFQNVFEKEVSNFQYPTVAQHYQLNTATQAALSFEDGSPFLMSSPNAYLFSASLQQENTNFTGSPIIVPVFYNMAIHSLKQSALYHVSGTNDEIDIPITLGNDEIVKLKQEDKEYIPRQQSTPQKITLFFDENFTAAGVFVIENKDTRIQNISFNYSRNESNLSDTDNISLPNTAPNTTIASVFNDFENVNSIHHLWKWFVTLALIFLLLEVLILKLFK